MGDALPSKTPPQIEGRGYAMESGGTGPMGTPTPGSQCLLKTKAGAAEEKTPQAHIINYINKKQQHGGGSRAREGTSLYNTGKQGLLKAEMEHKVRVAHDGGV